MNLAIAKRLKDWRAPSPAVKAVAISLTYFADHTHGDDIRPSIETLAEITRYSKRTVIRALKTLQELGLIELQANRGRYSPKMYRFTEAWTGKEKTTDAKAANETQTPAAPVRADLWQNNWKPNKTDAKPLAHYTPTITPNQPTPAKTSGQAKPKVENTLTLTSKDLAFKRNLEYFRQNRLDSQLNQALSVNKMIVTNHRQGWMEYGAQLIGFPDRERHGETSYDQNPQNLHSPRPNHSPTSQDNRGQQTKPDTMGNQERDRAIATIRHIARQGLTWPEGDESTRH